MPVDAQLMKLFVNVFVESLKSSGASIDIFLSRKKAPAMESNNKPTTPPMNITAKNLSGDKIPRGKIKRAIIKAPKIPPSVPFRLIPPSVPACTSLNVVILQVFPGFRVPISVAHVSAVAAANAPKAAIKQATEVSENQRAQKTAIQNPLAQTW